MTFKSKPDKPPSAAAENSDNKENQVSTYKAMTMMFKNKDFMVLTIFYGLVQSIQNTLGTIVAEVIEAFDYNSDDSSILGAVFIVGGVVGCVVFGIILEKTK